jgi:hypothetical protein
MIAVQVGQNVVVGEPLAGADAAETEAPLAAQAVDGPRGDGEVFGEFAFREERAVHGNRVSSGTLRMRDTAAMCVMPNRRVPAMTLEVYEGDTPSRRENSPWLIPAARIAFKTALPCLFLFAILELILSPSVPNCQYVA